MDKKDEIILQQLEVIRTMTERNLRSMGDDFWGTPFEGVLSPKSPSAPPSGGKPVDSADGKMPAQPSDGKTAGGQPAAKAEKTEVVEPLPKEDMKDLQAELDSYIGLATVKEEVRNLINMASVYKLRRQHDLPTTDMSLHMVFTGNPGTAKTTVARLFAQIMKENGLLPVGDLIEVGRADLVGKYVGWTAPTVKAKFAAAKGSVLFIDEAYSLVDDKDGLFGDEAINTIVQEMENQRDGTVVIFAGYPDKMEQFLKKNPGLRSRIAFHIPFEDYKPTELLDIFTLMAKQQKLELSSAVRERLLPIFSLATKQPDFGNGRFARNLLEKSRMKQASRLVRLEPDTVTAEMVSTLLPEDIDEPQLPQKEERRVLGFCA